MNDKRIMIFAPVNQRAWILSYYLRNIYNIEYPKSLLSILWIVNNCTDNSFQLLQEFKDRHNDEYESIDIQIWDNPEMGIDSRDTVHRNTYTYRWLSDLRNRGVSECIKHDCDYLFSCDSDILVRSNVLELLLKADKDYVAGLIYNGYETHESIYWQIPNMLRKEGNYYKHVNNYYTKNKLGVIEIDFSGAVFLANKKVLPFYKFAPDRMGEDLPACQSLQKAGFKIYGCCDSYSQHIMSPRWLKEFKNFGFEEDVDG